MKENKKIITRHSWVYALGEFILILLSILIALQVDNWNQNRQDRKLEHILLTEMLSNLKDDLEDIEYNTSIQQNYMNSTQVVLDFLKNDLPWHDSLGRHFTHLMAGSIFDINTSAYESLKSIGIDLIRNDNLRQQITEVYTARYTHVQANERILFTYIFDHLYPSIKENLITISPREITVPVNLDELRQNNSFIEELNMTLFVYRVSLLAYQQASESIIELIADIEHELGLDPEEPL